MICKWLKSRRKLRESRNRVFDISLVNLINVANGNEKKYQKYKRDRQAEKRYQRRIKNLTGL